MRIINSSSERSYSASLNSLYSNFYQANLDATKVIDIIENQGGKAYDDAGKDRTNDCLIGAYYAKGVSQGYLGNLYDRGIIVDDINQTEKGYPNSYKELTENGVRHIEKAIALAEASSNLQFDFLQGVTIGKDDFLKLANSIAARILSSIARDKAEAETLGSSYWQKVLAFAEKGLTPTSLSLPLLAVITMLCLTTLFSKAALIVLSILKCHTWPTKPTVIPTSIPQTPPFWNR